MPEITKEDAQEAILRARKDAGNLTAAVAAMVLQARQRQEGRQFLRGFDEDERRQRRPGRARRASEL